MTEPRLDDLVQLLRANDEAADWQPDSAAAFTRLADHLVDGSDAPAASSRRRVPFVLPRRQRGIGTQDRDASAIQVTIGDLTVIHRPDPPRRRRPLAQAALAVAAIVVLLVAGLIIGGTTVGTGDKSSRLRVVNPAATPSASPVPSPPGSTQQPRHRPASAPASVPSKTATHPTAAAKGGPPPAPLIVHVSVSKTTLHPGESLVVTYSWSDGDGQLLDLNHVESTATRIVRPRPCTQSSHVTHPGSGHGSYQFTFTYAGPTGVSLIAGLSLPFDHPERIRVGVDIGTGGQCAPFEYIGASQWVTLVPPVNPTMSPSTAAGVSPSPMSTTP